jgi:DNA-directed RNA polymerase specialized sigma24 family protein
MRATARTASLYGDASGAVREDLLQEPPLHLWSEMALGSDEHVATAFMERTGYWVAPRVRGPSRGTAIPFSRLAARNDASELADLRELVARPPKRQRAVVIMRYWQDAHVRDIAASLGVTLSAIRAMLARAYAKLRAAYEQSDP